ncbi:MAG: JAB domain-containing protein [Candidatus Poribacteria bacterium]|nr:JAB domain-containing protein [Candidatus Poribacteria bacterium]
MSDYQYHVQPRLFEARKLYQPEPVSTPKQLYELVRDPLEDSEQEHLLVVCLNAKSSLLIVECVSKGTLNCALMHPRDVFRTAIRENAFAIAVAHNPPSGDAEPSPPDIGMTKRIIEAGRLLNVPVVDHLIVGRRAYTSLAESRPELFRWEEPP